MQVLVFVFLLLSFIVYAQPQAPSQHLNINAVVSGSLEAILQSNTSETAAANGTMVCRPFGLCEPCPEDALHEPFCQPFGNRRLMHCSNATHPHSTASSSPHLPSQPPTRNRLDRQEQGETPAWQSCGRIPEQERADFYEFALCNLAFALVAGGMVVLRTRRMEAMLARRVAARIGLIRAG
ncbi:hypothetical protein OE88DRAFT_1662951 [Heliocybe sulcata]|uniref:Uncharacterized protein n=1 Tax=Heliocybe sulcata TaxID=5364 RepID=A0A5C3MVN3_9AGAM|nr:hypothetical protein OE88DRAFT_1662951 [Heliocybe sulcata]